jgi:hypothetical protein
MSSTYAELQGNGSRIDGRNGAAGNAGIDQSYQRLHTRAVLSQFVGRITGQQTALRSLGADLESYRICGQRHIGLKAVSLDHIIGSEGRSKDFDSQFRPLRTHTRARWCSVAWAHENDVTLPAIDLIQIGDSYYVRDGNHRVSVARASGQISIDANITELTVAPRPAVELTQTTGWTRGLAATAAA